MNLPAHVAACLTATVLFLLLLAHITIGAKPVELMVTPRLSIAPHQTLQIRVRVQPLATDRWLTVQMDDGDYRRESTWEPDVNRKLYSFEWRDVPAGAYDIVAAIGAGASPRASDRVSVQIGDASQR